MDGNRIVLIDGNGSEWFEQVIFILKSPGAAKAKNLVYEAEKIINEYMLTSKMPNPKLERYKKSIMERAASSETAVKNLQARAVPAAPTVLTRRTARKKIDFTSFFINICLVMASILLGYIMCTVMAP